MLEQIGAELQEEIPNANKQTVETIVKKCAFVRRLLYTLNKNKNEASELVTNSGSELGLSQNAGELLLKLQMKEKLALKMLSPDDLKHFMTIKTSLLEATILMMNLGWQ